MILPLAGCGAGSKTTSRTASTLGAPTATVRTSPPATTTSIPSTNGASSALLPASFVVNADNSLSPPLIAGPAGTAIQLTVTSRAPHPVKVTVASHSLLVQPSGHASMRLAGLRAGRYPVDVDGIKSAALVVGAQPGP